MLLKEANEIIWRPNSIRRLVMIGDTIPHEVNDNPLKLYWRQQVQYLKVFYEMIKKENISDKKEIKIR